MRRALEIMSILSLLFCGLSRADESDLVWSTFLGGNDHENAFDIAVDHAGNPYVTGYTQSPDFPTTSGAYDTIFMGSYEVYVVKFNSSGTSYDYATFLCHGHAHCSGKAIAVDDDGCAYVTGSIFSDELATTAGALDSTYNGRNDLFIAKLNSMGSGLEYCTYLGGSMDEDASGIAVDHQGCAYVTGWTWSCDFPTMPGSFDTTPDQSLVNWDAFISKISPSGEALEYSTFLGGMTDDFSDGIAVDKDGHAYVTGQTSCADFPVTIEAFDTTYNGGGSWGYDAFVTKLNPTGSDLVFSTFLGSTDDDLGLDIAVDEGGATCIAGWTKSEDFPTTTGAFSQTYQGGFYDGDAFVAKLDARGTDLICSTFLGGTNDDYAIAVALDSIGTTYVIGETNSSDFPVTAAAFDTSHSSGWDVYTAKFNALCSTLEYASFLGGSDIEYACGISLDGAGNAYLTGQTKSDDFPTTPGALDTIYSNYEAFVTKLSLGSTSVSSEALAENLPLICIIHQNFPNPFNANTEIQYSIPADGHVTLKIFNTLGQQVRTLMDTDQPAGEHIIHWDGRDDTGQDVASGLYFCRLKSEGSHKTIKMVLVK